jgi:uncharacterized membrane protein
MEEIFGILLALGFLTAILVGPWILVWRSSRARERQRLEDQTRWSDLTHRIHVLEQKLQSGSTVAPVTPPPPPIEKPIVSAPPRVVEPIVAPPAPKLVDPPRVFVPPTRVSPPPAATPSFSATPADAPKAPTRKSALDVEEMLGANWLNKLGIGLVVLGIASLIAFQLKNFGPMGKVLLGFALSVAMLAVGVWFERADRYRILARASVGGGWALLFFTTYAMHFVPAAHVIASEVLDLVLLLGVAIAMVVHTLRYRSQVVTGLAFLLAFMTVGMSHSNVYSLVSGALLAGGLVVVVGRMQWFELEIFGILATYFNHYLWLRPFIEPMKQRHSFPEFPASVAILTLYWAIFRASYVWRTPSSKRQERSSTVAALLNTALLLLLFKYQSTHPEWAFWALLAIGGIEAAIGQTKLVRRRRTAFVVLNTLGVILIVAAYPFRRSDFSLSVVWLLEAEALLLIGVWTREIVFRRLGGMLTLLVSASMISRDAARVYGMRMDGADVSPKWAIAVLFIVAAFVSYANAHWILPRWRELFTHEIDRRVMQRLSYVGALLAATAVWLAFPEAWTAVAWSLLGLALVVASRHLATADLGYQGNLLALAAVVRALSINLETSASLYSISQRLITVSAVAAVLYLTSRVATKAPGTADNLEERLTWFLREGFYTWSASLLLGLLAWYELRAVGVAVAWAVGGLVLLEIGLSSRALSLRLQSYAALLAAFLRIFFVNLNAAGKPGEISPRFYTVVPIAAACFYAYWRMHDQRESLTQYEQNFRLIEICSWSGTLSVVSLVRFELEPDWVATGWSALAFCLTALAWWSRRRVFLYQSLLLAFGVFFRTSMHNFYERSYFPSPAWQTRWVTVGSALAFLLVSLYFLFQLREKKVAVEEVGIIRWVRALVRRPEQVFFFVMLALLTILLAIEMRHGMVTLAWSVEAFVTFMFALWVGERSFRLAGLGLLLLCVGKILLIDVWRLNPSDRYLTLIVLGVALLAVSFLYTRFRDAIRQYL